MDRGRTTLSTLTRFAPSPTGFLHVGNLRTALVAWLAARAEGVGVGWVSILDVEPLRRVLHVPEKLTVVAYLCVGYVDRFEETPDLESLGCEQRREMLLALDGCDPAW